MMDYAQARRLMVDCQLRTFDVTDARLLAAFDSVPRETFVAAGQEPFAYSDRDLPLTPDGSRRMLAPMVLARLVQALAVAPGARVLDVACGSGYAAALLGELGATVDGLESEVDLAETARARLPGAMIHGGPLADGWSEGAPYDAILIEGATETRPDALLAQLRDGGRLACVVGRGRSAKATLFVRGGETAGSRPLFDAAAPPLEAFRAEAGFVF